MVLMLFAGDKNADDGLGFIFSGLGGGGASGDCWLHANKQTSNRAATEVCEKGFIIFSF